MWKLLSKEVANRLKFIVGELVSGNEHPFMLIYIKKEHPFIYRRQIPDAPVMASGVVDFELRSTISGLLLMLGVCCRLKE